MGELEWLLLTSKIAGIGLVISFTILLATSLVWACFYCLDFQLKRLQRALKVQDVREFAKEYIEWKAERKEQE